MESLKAEVAAVAARLVVEEGMAYGAAKRRALRQLGATGAAALPDNDAVEAAVREYISIFCADTQPQELAALRRVALRWMNRLARFRPYLAGPVWTGTATRLSDVSIQLFCDDPKSAEFELIDMGISYETGEVEGLRGEPVPALGVTEHNAELGEPVGIRLMIYDHDALRGALRRDGQGRAGRGDVAALRGLLED